MAGETRSERRCWHWKQLLSGKVWSYTGLECRRAGRRRETQTLMLDPHVSRFHGSFTDMSPLIFK